MNASAIQYTDSNSMIHISKSYNLVCEYDGNKPDQIEIPELNLVLKKGNWLIKVEENFLVCESSTRSTLYGDVHPVVNPEVRFKKDLGQMIHDSVKTIIKKDQRLGGLPTGNKFAEGGYIKPPYITEMEEQIKALSMAVSALSNRIEVLDSKK